MCRMAWSGNWRIRVVRVATGYIGGSCIWSETGLIMEFFTSVLFLPMCIAIEDFLIYLRFLCPP